MMLGNSNGAWLYFNNNSKKMVINSWDKPDDGNRWLIEPVADFDPTEALELAAQSLFVATYDYVYDGQVVYSETQRVFPGDFAPEPSLQANDFVELEPEGELPDVVTEDFQMDYQVVWNGPFEFTHSLNDAHWYNMTIRSYYYVGYSEEEPYYPSNWVDEEILLSPEFQWAFGGDPLHIKVYNRATGMEQVLTLVGEAGGNQVNTVMREGDYSWAIRPNADGFVLSPHDYPDVCINQIGGQGGPLQTWNDHNSPTDNGSTFRIYEALFDGISTAQIANGKWPNGQIFDLAGRPVGLPRKAGLYIVNGKKVLVK
jgi:hypothetical protein